MSTMKNDTRSIMLVGVGGQGTILASKILTTGLISTGYDVKMSEIHGMSQRGGSVSTQVRFGRKVYSPIIGRGQADILVAFETMEAMRYLPDLKVGGKIVVNDYKMPSMPILAGDCEYPDGIIEELKSKAETLVLDASAVANEQGNPRGMNVVLLGALIRTLELQEIDWTAAVRSCMKSKLVDMNLRCLEAGMRTAEEVLKLI